MVAGGTPPALTRLRIALAQRAYRPNITIFFTLLAVGVAFGWLGVEDPSKWREGIVLYILGCTSPFLPYSFEFNAIWLNANKVDSNRISMRADLLDGRFPRPRAGPTRGPGLQGSDHYGRQNVRYKFFTPSFQLFNLTISEREHADFESLARNRISNVSFAICSAGEILILAVMVGIVKGLHAGDSTENNTRAFSVLCAFSGGVWLLCALPWFFLEQRRPGLALPEGTSLLTIGFKQTGVAFRECLRLKQTFLYLIFYFLMGDVLNTTVTVIGTLQNRYVRDIEDVQIADELAVWLHIRPSTSPSCSS
jgi:hypothetical protein